VPTTHAPVPLTAQPGPLLDLVRAVAADPARWQPAVRCDARERYWSRLLQTPDVDLWLLTWLPGQQTSLHDHGPSAAAVTVLSGTVEEVRADPDGTLRSEHLTAGSTVWVPPGAVHDVLHAGAGPAVSLHAYSPRLTRMTYYEPTSRGLRAVRTVVDDEPEHEVAS
jgi:quercetin dioxygenase-like cupin family protein